MDYLYANEWKQCIQRNQLMVIPAFSRDGSDKVYVQHKIQDNKALIKDWIVNKNATVLLSGNAKNMPTSVKEAIDAVLDGVTSVKELEKCRRFQQEVW